MRNAPLVRCPRFAADLPPTCPVLALDACGDMSLEWEGMRVSRQTHCTWMRGDRVWNGPEEAL
jgi:hypothetical protein